MVDRDALINATGITLDGVPAKIVGRNLEFPIVSAKDGRRFEWAWETAARIVANGGTFKS